jgi:hypothetical protein
MHVKVFRLASLCAVTLSGWAAAQSGFSVRASAEQTANEVRFGPSSCDSDFAYLYRVAITVQVCQGNLVVWATNGSCGSQPGATDLTLATQATGDLNNIPQTNGFRSVSRTVKLSTLPGFVSADGGAPCGQLTGERVFTLCGTVPTGQNFCANVAPNNISAESLKLVYDNDPPAAPVVSAVEALDSSLKLTFSVNASDIRSVSAEYARVDSLDGGVGEYVPAAGSGVSSGSTAINVRGLENGTTYDVRLVAEDTSGNVGPTSSPIRGTPILTRGFVGALNDASDYAPGGCSTTAAPLVMGAILIQAAALVTARRRRNRQHNVQPEGKQS